MLQDMGYTSMAHKKLIKCVTDKNETLFMDILAEFTNHEIENHRQSITPPNSFEKLISVWKKKKITDKNDISNRVLLYFANMSEDGSNVNKQETVTAYSYMIRMKVKFMYFLHINNMSSISYKQLTQPNIIPSSDCYSIMPLSASVFDINIKNHLYVPKHTLVKDPVNFYKEEELTKGTLPKIYKNDPAILLLGAKPGIDIVRIERTEEFDHIPTIYFREVIGNNSDFV